MMLNDDDDDDDNGIIVDNGEADAAPCVFWYAAVSHYTLGCPQSPVLTQLPILESCAQGTLLAIADFNRIRPKLQSQHEHKRFS